MWAKVVKRVKSGKCGQKVVKVQKVVKGAKSGKYGQKVVNVGKKW